MKWMSRELPVCVGVIDHKVMTVVQIMTILAHLMPTELNATASASGD